MCLNCLTQTPCDANTPTIPHRFFSDLFNDSSSILHRFFNNDSSPILYRFFTDSSSILQQRFFTDSSPILQQPFFTDSSPILHRFFNNDSSSILQRLFNDSSTTLQRFFTYSTNTHVIDLYYVTSIEHGPLDWSSSRVSFYNLTRLCLVHRHKTHPMHQTYAAHHKHKQVPSNVDAGPNQSVCHTFVVYIR